eukprot:4561008-Lingulodinium_polyedra.AAC.1
MIHDPVLLEASPTCHQCGIKDLCELVNELWKLGAQVEAGCGLHDCKAEALGMRVPSRMLLASHMHDKALQLLLLEGLDCLQVVDERHAAASCAVCGSGLAHGLPQHR